MLKRGILTILACLLPLIFGCVGVVSVGPDLVVGKRVNRGDAQW